MKAMATGLVLGAMVTAGVYVNGEHQANGLYKSQIAACKRGNLVRAESNARIAEHDKQDRVQRIILSAAIRVRLATWRSSHDRADVVAYHRYRYGLKVNRTIHFSRQPLIDCRKVIPKP